MTEKQFCDYQKHKSASFDFQLNYEVEKDYADVTISVAL